MWSNPVCCPPSLSGLCGKYESSFTLETDAMPLQLEFLVATLPLQEVETDPLRTSARALKYSNDGKIKATKNYKKNKDDEDDDE